MSLRVLNKLLAIFCTVALGWAAGRLRWLGEPAGGLDPARLLGNAAFYIFVPALLFRTTARLDVAHLPWATVVAFFVPVVGVMLLVYGLQRWWGRQPVGADLQASERAAAVPAVRAVTSVFGNSVQVGIPVVTALFGEAGLGIHIALVSLHALVLLSVLTVLVELDVARARAQHDATAGLLRTLRSTVRNTLIHPVVLPVLAGLVWHATGWPLPGPLDETLQLLGTAVAPLCLVLIGITLAQYAKTLMAPVVATIAMCIVLVVLPLVLTATSAVMLLVTQIGAGALTYAIIAFAMSRAEIAEIRQAMANGKSHE